jgi:hypothetical protein
MREKGSTNYLRRGTTALIGVAPVFLLAVSIAYGSTHSTKQNAIGFALVALGTLVATLNFYLSFVRYFLYRLRQGSAVGYRNVSGFPIVGTLLVTAGGLISFGSAPIAVFGLFTMFIDTGGSLWFLESNWRDSSFWGE